MICVVIDAAADAAGAAGAAEGVAPIRMTGTTTGGRYGTRVQVRDGGLTAPALTTDTEWDLKTGDGTGVPATDKTGGRIPAHWPGPPFWCARWAHVLTGESPQSARQWEGYSRSQGCPP